MSSDASSSPPDSLGAAGDPGDETAQRYQYQWSYAAVACCMLLDSLEDVREVFCEQHEDILLKHRDGLFTGIQVKTRDSTQPLWKTGDAAVLGSCARFARLEALFPGHFRGFRFLTNHPLYTSGNGRDLRHVLGAIRCAASAAEVPKLARSFLKRIAKEAECGEDVASAALGKTEASDRLPKLHDIRTRLITELTQVWDQASDCTAPALMRAADHLAQACGQASSLAHEGLLPVYLPMSVNPTEADLVARIHGKRFTRDRILGLLVQGLDRVAPLHGDPAVSIQPGSGQGDLLIKKLDAGGFSAVSRNSAVDLRDKADYLGVVWMQKYGRSAGLKRYDHIRSTVLSDAARAYEATNSTGFFGLRMLEELRSRFRRRRRERAELYDCSNEHLEGFAYSLTSQCQIQWSLDRPWEDK